MVKKKLRKDYVNARLLNGSKLNCNNDNISAFQLCKENQFFLRRCANVSHFPKTDWRAEKNVFFLPNELMKSLTN